MLRSCKYCGRVHPTRYVCPMRTKNRKHKDEKIDRFRKTAQWMHKRTAVLERDGYRCSLCDLEREPRRYNPGRLSVHHIEPLKARWDLRLEDWNLLTVCDRHHEAAERGEYEQEMLHSLTGVPPGGIG